MTKIPMMTYAWYANFITIFRRKFTVLMNDLTMYWVVHYGLKMSDFKHAKVLFQKAIIVAMHFERYDGRLILNYIHGMKDITYGKSKSRKLVAQSNRAMQDAD